MEYDINDDDPTYINYFEHGDPDHSAWTPTPPAGDGWFVLYIGDTEDGPQCVFARRESGGAK